MKNTREITGTLFAESEKARRVRVGVVGRQIWIPKSLTFRVIKFAPNEFGEREVRMEVEEWFLEKEGL
jgi:hypothetical protein